MNEKVVVCGNQTSGYLALGMCATSELPFNFVMLKDDSFDEEKFERIAILNNVQTDYEITADTYKTLGNADLLVITKLIESDNLEMTMHDYVAQTIPLLRKLINEAMERGFKGKICFALPYDEVFTYLGYKFSGLPKSNVFGIGTFSSTIQFEQMLQKKIGVGENDVHAYVLGTGRERVPFWSRSYLGVSSVLGLLANKSTRLNNEDVTEIDQAIQEVNYVKQPLVRLAMLPAIMRALFLKRSFISTFTAINQTPDKQKEVAYSLPVYLSEEGVHIITVVTGSETETNALNEIILSVREFLDEIEQGELELDK